MKWRPTGIAATLMAAGSIVVGGGVASAATSSGIPDQPIDGYGYVGRFWCGDDQHIRTKNGTGSIGIQIHSSDFNGQAQTIKIKAVDPHNLNNTFAQTDFFSIPNTNHDATLDHNLFNGEKFKICAEFGGGDPNPNHSYYWKGKIFS